MPSVRSLGLIRRGFRRFRGEDIPMAKVTHIGALRVVDRQREGVRDQLKRVYDDITRERIPDDMRRLVEGLR
jgi:hypothetical protein